VVNFRIFTRVLKRAGGRGRHKHFIDVSALMGGGKDAPGWPKAAGIETNPLSLCGGDQGGRGKVYGGSKETCAKKAAPSEEKGWDQTPGTDKKKERREGVMGDAKNLRWLLRLEGEK